MSEMACCLRFWFPTLLVPSTDQPVLPSSNLCFLVCSSYSFRCLFCFIYTLFLSLFLLVVCSHVTSNGLHLSYPPVGHKHYADVTCTSQPHAHSKPSSLFAFLSIQANSTSWLWKSPSQPCSSWGSTHPLYQQNFSIAWRRRGFGREERKGSQGCGALYYPLHSLFI